MTELNLVKSMDTKYRDFDDFVWLPNWFYKTMGYDFIGNAKPRWKTWTLHCYFAACFFSHLFAAYYMIKDVLKWNVVDINARTIMRYGELGSFVINSNVKFATFLIYRRRILKLINKLKIMYPSTQKDRCAHRVNTYYWPFWTRFIVGFFYVDCLIMVLGPVLQSVIFYGIELIRFGSDSAQFLNLRCYPMNYGFNSENWLSYFLTQVVDITFSQFIVNVSLGIDLWVCCLAAQLVMHFDYIGNTLACYEPSENNELNDCRFLAALVTKHQHVLSLQKELDELFGVLLVYNLLATAATLCCVAFYTIVQGINLESLSYMMFFFIASAQFYMICNHGQLLITKSEKISDAAYEHNWYNGTIKYKKLLVLLMIRAQKPAALSARGFMIISLDTFKILMNITYRSFALVRTMLK